MSENNYPYAEYTETFIEFTSRNPTFLTDVINASTFNKQDYADEMISVLKGRFNSYEISGETEDLFKQFFTDTFNQWKTYYIEILNSYYDEWKVKDGITRNVISRNDVNGSTDTDDTNTFYDLPHKVTTEAENFPDNTTKNKGKTTNSNTNEYSSTTTDNSNYLTQKARYINMIRNIYNEFASRFEDCFIHLFN